MILDANAIEESMTLAAARFASFRDWEYQNEVSDEYAGFTLWSSHKGSGEDVPTYYVTFTLWNDRWRGFLTTGQPWYYWSSASEGDVLLVGTGDFQTLAEAISALKTAMRELIEILTR